MTKKSLHFFYFVFVILFVFINIVKVNMSLFHVFQKFVQVQDGDSGIFYSHDTRDCLTWRPVHNQSFEMHCKALQCIAYAHASPQKNQMTQNAVEPTETSEDRKSFFEKVIYTMKKWGMLAQIWHERAWVVEGYGVGPSGPGSVLGATATIRWQTGHKQFAHHSFPWGTSREVLDKLIKRLKKTLNKTKIR